MRLKEQEESENFTDRFGDTRIQKFMNYLFYSLNPIYAQRKVRETLIKRGYIEPKNRSPFGTPAERAKYQ